MPDSFFDTALAFVLEREGGAVITDDPKDPGGLTRWGICQRAYPDLNIRALTREQATTLYRRDYWEAGGCDALPPAVAAFHFDCCVNQGLTTAVRFLQRAIGVEPDGQFGPKTLVAVQRKPSLDLLTEYAAQRLNHYGRLPHFTTYGLGWSRRLTACLAMALGINR